MVTFDDRDVRGITGVIVHINRFIAHTKASTGPRFIKDGFDALLECGILAHAYLRLRCGECDHDKLLLHLHAPRFAARGAALGACPRRLRTWSITPWHCHQGVRQSPTVPRTVCVRAHFRLKFPPGVVTAP